MSFYIKNINQKIYNLMPGFVAGVMIAASFQSLIRSVIEMAEESGSGSWMPVFIWFLPGGSFLLLNDRILPHLLIGLAEVKAVEIKTQWQASVKETMIFILTCQIMNRTKKCYDHDRISCSDSK